jgi:hypothetical protein
VALLLAAGCGGTQSIPDQLLLNPGPGSEAQNPNLLAGQGTQTTPNPSPTSPDTASAFCRDLVDQLNQLPNLFNASSPDELKTELNRIRAKNPNVLQEAPASIKGAVVTVVRFEDRVYNDISSNPGDIPVAVSSAAFQSALRRLQLYAVNNCGLTRGPPP